MKEAPLFVRAYDLHAYLLDRLEAATQRPEVRQSVLRSSCHLLEALTLAVQGFDTAERARDADEAAALLRLHLRLAEQKGLLEPNQYKHGVEALDDIGRQLGGWRKRLERL